MQTQPSIRRRHFRTGFLAGLIASVPTTLLMVILSLFGGVSLPDLLASAISVALPPPAFEYLHTVFGDASKQYLLYIVLVGQCLVLACCGGLYQVLLTMPRLQSWLDQHPRWQRWNSIILAGVLWLFAVLLFLPLTGAGFFGSSLPSGWVDTTGSLAIESLIFSRIFVYALRWLRLRAESEADSRLVQRRRDLLGTGLKLLGLGTIGVLAWRFITANGASSNTLPESAIHHYQPRIVPPPEPNYGQFDAVSGLTPEVTPAESFYVVSKNFTADPKVNSAAWKLTIDGLVERPYTLTYEQLLALPLKQQYESMMCISNIVGGTLMGNAQWEGVPMKDLLQQAGSIREGATKVVFYGADGYTDSIHLSKALEPTTFVAVRMNGERLPDNHGYPARVLVPGIYGMKHVKWLQRIKIVDNDFQGYWQQAGWSDPAPIRMTVRIDVPHRGSRITAHKPQYIAGVAFSGDKGISQVNVSTDSGKTWQVATLKQPLSALTWVLWELPWEPESGTNTIVAHAVDREGNVQNPEVRPPLPDGSSGYHIIQVEAE